MNAAFDISHCVLLQPVAPSRITLRVFAEREFARFVNWKRASGEKEHSPLTFLPTHAILPKNRITKPKTPLRCN